MLTRAQKRKSEGDLPSTKRLSIVLERFDLANSLTAPTNTAAGSTQAIAIVQPSANDPINHPAIATEQATSASAPAQKGDGDQASEAERTDTGQASSTSAPELNGNGDQATEEEAAAFVAKPGDPVTFKYVAASRMGQQVFYSIDEKQKYKVNKKNCGSNDNKYTQLTCCKDKCPARIWLYESGAIFAPKFKPHNHLDNAEETVKYNAVMEMCKQESATLKLVNGKLPTLDEIFRKNATE